MGQLNLGVLFGNELQAASTDNIQFFKS